MGEVKKGIVGQIESGVGEKNRVECQVWGWRSWAGDNARSQLGAQFRKGSWEELKR
jgi:hypothetical protein